MLVYLDHSHFVLLSEAALKAPEEFSTFVSAWHDQGLILALSRVHLMEMRRHADPAVRVQRYRLLEHFVPFRSEIGPNAQNTQTIVEIEIRAALTRRLIEHFGIKDANVSVDIFGGMFSDVGDVQALKELEAPVFDGVLDLFHEGAKASVDALSRPLDQPYKPVKTSDLPGDPIGKKEAEKAIEDLENALGNDPTLSALLSGPHSPAVRNALDPIIDGIKDFIRDCENVGPAKAYGHFIGADLSALGNQSMDRTVYESVFRDELKRVVHSLPEGTSPDIVSSLSNRVAVRDCPGHWLSRELDMEIRTAEPVQDPSNVYDVDHVTYFPYVDIFFADKRITEYVRRILQRSGGPLRVSATQGPHSTTRSLASLRDRLASLNGAGPF